MPCYFSEHNNRGSLTVKDLKNNFLSSYTVHTDTAGLLNVANHFDNSPSISNEFIKC